MTRYELLVFLHVSCAIIWLGANFVLNLLVVKAGRSGDPLELSRLAEANKWLAPRMFIPVSMLTLVFGVLLVADGPWTFAQLWIVLGLSGFAATFLIGIGFLEPESKRLDAAVAAAGPASPEAQRHTRRLILVARLDLALLFAIVAVMASKPATEDTWTLVGLGAVLVAAWIALAAVSRPRDAAAPAGLPALSE